MNGLQFAPEPLSEALRKTSPHPAGGAIGGLGFFAVTPSWINLFGVREVPSGLLQRAEPESGTRVFTGGYRAREQEWRRNHADDLRAFQHEWVVLEGEQIVAHGRDPVRVVEEARALGVRNPYVFFVESSDQEDLVFIGL
jgi:hypothetical protein